MKVLVFLPTYNEKGNIGKIIEEINKLDFDKEILIVDDYSTDGTIDVIKEKITTLRNLKLIIRKNRRGRGYAGIRGLKYFINSENDVMVEMDADFSHHPKFIPHFLKLFPKYDVVIGSRLIENGDQWERKKIRNIISILANLIIRIILQVNIKDCTSGFRAFKKEILKNLDFDKFISINPEIVEELLYGCVLCKAKIKEFPIVYYERSSGKSKLDLKKLLKVLVGIVKIRLRGKIIIKSKI